MNKELKNNLESILINGIVFISTLICSIYGFLYGAGSGQVGEKMIGIGYFKPFTIDSNIFAGICSAIIIFYNIKNIIKKVNGIPKWVISLHLIGTSALTLTFITVILFLVPMDFINGIDGFRMFKGNMFFFHLLNPILSIISFVFIQKQHEYIKKECFLGLIPTIIYSIVYMTMVLVVKCWTDFYNFTLGGRYLLIPVVFIVMYGVTMAISLVLIRLHNKSIT